MVFLDADGLWFWRSDETQSGSGVMLIVLSVGRVTLRASDMLTDNRPWLREQIGIHGYRNHSQILDACLLFYDTSIPDLSMQNSFPGKKGVQEAVIGYVIWYTIPVEIWTFLLIPNVWLSLFCETQKMIL